MLLFVGMHQEPESKAPPGIRRLLPAEILVSELTFRTSSGIARSWHLWRLHARLPDSGFTRAAPDANRTLAGLLCAVNRASVISEVLLREERLLCHNFFMCGRYRLSQRKQIIEEHFASVSRMQFPGYTDLTT